MADEDQSEVVAFLARGEIYGRPGETPERIDTHSSIVFLIGDRVFKLKRAVRFSFLDYSTLAAREHFCRAELALNRRTAPELYLGLRAITRSAQGQLEWDGQGPVVDWALEMRRFDQEALFDRLAVNDRLTPALMMALADAIAAFHQEAERVDAFGGSKGIAEVIADNNQYLAAACPPLDGASIESLATSSHEALERVRGLLDDRRLAGQVRRCHGDLHLRNICLFDGKPTLFDCIEFSDAIACIDVLYDLGFLLMDLEHRALRRLGNIVFNRYFDRRDEVSGLAALPLFLSVRAGVRAKVAVTALRLNPAVQAAEARAYVELARSLIEPSPPRLLAVGGLSGSGKSTVASALACDFGPAPGARLLRSDVMRKSLMGVAPETRLPPSAYTRDVSTRVYQALYDQAAKVLASGYTAIVDATFMDQAAREAVASVAQKAGVPFVGLWLDAPAELLLRRIASRHGDASDADHAVLLQQLQASTGSMTWLTVDAGGGIADSVAAARRAIAKLRI